jgi:hypothetical protein
MVQQKPAVKPTEWTYLALIGLDLRYDCGIFDSIDRDQPVSSSILADRYWSCVKAVSEIVRHDQPNIVSKEDLDVFIKLESEFQSELFSMSVFHPSFYRYQPDLADGGIPDQDSEVSLNAEPSDRNDLAQLARKYDCPAKYSEQKQELTRQEFAQRPIAIV